MKLFRLINARAVIAKCAKERLPAQTAYKLVKFLKCTDNDETFYNEKFRSILNQYAKKDEDGNFMPSEGGGIALKPETAEACNKEILELENTEIDNAATFTIDEFSGICLSMSDIFAIEELIIEKESSVYAD